MRPAGTPFRTFGRGFRASVHRIASFVVVVGLFVFASTLPAGAQSIRESAERLARRSAAVQPGAPLALRARSMVRTWAGVGLVAGGLAMMFTGQDDCVATGGLATIEPYQDPRVGYVALAGSNLRGERIENPEGCAFHFDLTGTVGLRSVDTFITGGVEPFTDGFWVGYGDGRPIERIQGDVAVDSVRPKFRLWGGAALVAGGALLATVWADAPVDVSGDVRQVRVSRTIGW